MRGRCSTPQAMLIRRFIPPEKPLTGSSARSSSPVARRAHFTWPVRSGARETVQTPEGREVFPRAQARVDGNLLRNDSEFGGVSPNVRGLPKSRISPASSCTRPEIRADERGLPGAVGSQQRQQLPFAE